MCYWLGNVILHFHSSVLINQEFYRERGEFLREYAICANDMPTYFVTNVNFASNIFYTFFCINVRHGSVVVLERGDNVPGAGAGAGFGGGRAGRAALRRRDRPR